MVRSPRSEVIGSLAGFAKRPVHRHQWKEARPHPMLQLRSALKSGWMMVSVVMRVMPDLYYFYATTPSLRRLSMSASLMPNVPCKISPVCCPSEGGGVRMPGFEYEYFTGVFTSLIGPQEGWSTSWTMPRATTATY